MRYLKEKHRQEWRRSNTNSRKPQPDTNSNKMEDRKLDRQELLLNSTNSFGMTDILNNDSTLIKKLKSGSYNYGNILSIRDTLAYCLESKTFEKETYNAEALLQILTDMLNQWMYEIFDRDYYNKTS